MATITCCTLDRIEPHAGWLALLAATALAVLLFAGTWVHPATSWIGYDDDPHLFIWYLGWAPHQLAALRSPLFSDVLQAPGGVNLMWNTAVVAPAIALWPVTAAFGPIVSYNVLVTASVALSGWVAFLAARRLVGGVVPPALAGLVYGFSPYMVAQSLRHPHVSLAVFPPLALLLLHELVVRRRRGALGTGALLGAAAAVQFLTGEEILAYTALVAGLGVLLLAALHRREVAARAPRVLAGLAVALGCFLVLAAYPLWFQFFGPQRVSGVLQPPGVYVNDLLGFVVPSDLMALSGGFTSTITHAFTGNIGETDAYLGVPLLALLVVACATGWRRPLVRWAAPLGAAAALLSLGPQLHVGGQVLPIPLPGAVAGRLPLLESAVPARLMLFGYLMVALILADLVRAAGRRRLAFAAVAIALVPLVPRWPYPSTPAGVPAFFQPGGASSRLTPDDMVLILPYADHLSSQAMLWQATAGYRFRMPEGEAFVPGPSLGPPPSELRVVFEALEGGVPVPDSAADRAEALRELAALGVDTVVVGPYPHHDRMVAYLTGLLGRPPVPSGGVDVWWDVRPPPPG